MNLYRISLIPIPHDKPRVWKGKKHYVLLKSCFLGCENKRKSFIVFSKSPNDILTRVMSVWQQNHMNQNNGKYTIKNFEEGYVQIRWLMGLEGMWRDQPRIRMRRRSNLRKKQIRHKLHQTRHHGGLQRSHGRETFSRGHLHRSRSRRKSRIRMCICQCTQHVYI